MADGIAGVCGCFILKTAVEVFVGANLFARSSSYVRINSHLHERLNAVNYLSIRFQLRFLGLFFTAGYAALHGNQRRLGA
jgi:hypothetical protein